MIEHEQAVGWEESDKGKPWTGAELRVILSDAPTKDNWVKHVKGRGCGRPDICYGRNIKNEEITSTN